MEYGLRLRSKYGDGLRGRKVLKKETIFDARRNTKVDWIVSIELIIVISTET